MKATAALKEKCLATMKTFQKNLSGNKIFQDQLLYVQIQESCLEYQVGAYFSLLVPNLPLFF